MNSPKQKAIGLVVFFASLALTLILLPASALAATHSAPTPGGSLPGVNPGDTISFSEDTVWARLTARWGVRVIFQDDDMWGNVVFSSVLVLVPDGETLAPPTPNHADEGYEFAGWVRVDNNAGSALLGDDGSVTGVDGPGPIVFQATYVKEQIPTEPGPEPSTPKPPVRTVLPPTGDDGIDSKMLAVSASMGCALVAAVLRIRRHSSRRALGGMLLLFGAIVVAALSFNATPARAADEVYVYGVYSMSYLPGTVDTVSDMPASEVGLAPGDYSVSMTIPKREGYEFVDWLLEWGTMEKPTLTNYIVRYLYIEDESPLCQEKHVESVEIGAEITEVAIQIPDFIALDPTEKTMEMKEEGNVFIFYYDLAGDF